MEVRASNIKKDFVRKNRGSNRFTAVHPCDFVLPAGQLIVVSGRSGGGKSTLPNILAGILAPTSGRVCYGDQEIYALSDEMLSEFRNRHIGYIPQGKSAVSSLTVLENVMLPLTLFGDRDDKEAMRLMELFEIAHLKDVLPNEMSGGELRRMAIARAMMRKPEVLFADEPTGDLDDYHTKLVFQVLREAADQGAAVMVVTHEGEAADYADRVYRMDAGELDDGKEKNG